MSDAVLKVTVLAAERRPAKANARPHRQGERHGPAKRAGTTQRAGQWQVTPQRAPDRGSPEVLVLALRC